MKNLPLYQDLQRPQLPRHAERSPAVRSLDMIQYIVPHHTGDWVTDFTQHARYHVNRKGWAALGYHMYYTDGSIAVSRELTEIGAHVLNFNTHSVGVCIPGNFNERPPTDAEYWQWLEMILIVEQYLGRPLRVKLHSQMSPTTCPGRHFDIQTFMSHLSDLRTLVQQWH